MKPFLTFKPEDFEHDMIDTFESDREILADMANSLAAPANARITELEAENERLRSALRDALVELEAEKIADCANDQGHNMEPNTTMDYFRCDRCGVRPKTVEAISKIEAILKDCGVKG